MRASYLLLLNLGLPLGCKGEKEESEADLLISNAVVYTMDEDDTRAEAVAVDDGRIVFVGSAEDAEPWITDGTERVDLGGKPLLPGFVDAHTHLVWSATQLLDADLYAATSLDELAAIIQETAEARPDEPWVRGVGWDATIFEGMLDRELLDAVVPDRPAYMESADSHSAWVNTLALEEAGITADTPDPESGEIVRDDSGEATGILREDAMALVSDVMPGWSEDQVDDGLESALAEAAGYGLTSFVDACCEDWMLEGYQRAEAAGTLTGRVRCALPVDAEAGAEQIDDMNALRSAYTGDLVQVNAVKLYLDGVIESQTAYMLEPYVDGTNGEPSFEDDHLADLVAAFDGEGYQLHAHAIGDAAIRQFLDALATLDAADRRPLIAHLEAVDPADAPRFASLGAWADVQALWAYPDPYITELTIPVIGEERAKTLYVFGDIAAAGGTLVAGSDWSVTTMNPWEAIEVAVTRRDPYESTGDQLNPEQALTVQQMLVAYTRDGARAAMLDDVAGKIEVGLRADLIALDRDPFDIDPTELSDVRVTRTWFDGRESYVDD